MKIPIYTKDKNLDFNKKEIVSAEEWAETRKKGWEFKVGNKFSSGKDYINWGLKYEREKFKLGAKLTRILNLINAKKVLSLGAGGAYVEYSILKNNPEIRIKVSDFDSFIINKVRKLLPEFKDAEVFDFKKQDFSKFKGYDTALLVGVFSCLFDEEANVLLRNLRDIGIKNIFIVTAAYLYWANILKVFLRSLMKKGRFHAFSRSKSEFKKIINIVNGIRIKKIINIKRNNSKQLLIHIVCNKNEKGLS